MSTIIQKISRSENNNTSRPPNLKDKPTKKNLSIDFDSDERIQEDQPPQPKACCHHDAEVSIESPTPGLKKASVSL